MSLRKRRFALTLVSTVSLAACGGGGGDSTPTPLAQTPLTCQQLVGMSVPASEIALPTSGAAVTAATTVAAAGSGATAVPEHCLVTAAIAPVDPTAPKIMFKLALPAAWNNKALMLGGGGFDGTIPNVVGNISNGPTDKPLPVARGYAVFASDSGHQANALGSLDGAFGLNDEALRNWGGDALKKTRDAAMFLIKKRYAAAPAKSFFAGGSTGGRESLSQIQRWPADWDGAIAWYPAWNQASAMLGGQKGSVTLSKPGAYPNGAKRLALFQAAMQACDALDGVTDGLVSNQSKCNATFDPATATLNGAPLRCAGGADTGDNCLSDVQIAALKAINAPVKFGFTLASGETGYPGYNVWGSDLGIPSINTAIEPTVTFLNFGSSAPANPMPTTAPYISRQLDQVLKTMIARDASFDSLTFDPTTAVPANLASRFSDLSRMIDDSTDISAFVNRGGKLLLAHGLSDVLVSTRATADYYSRLVRQFGQLNVDNFARYYEIAGLGHAVSSQFNATWDSLAALEAWAEKGTAPSGQVTTDTVGVPGRTRPLCDYPKWVKYKGTGDVNQASSFTCVAE